MPPPRSGPVFVGIDIGTSSVKAVMGGAGGALHDKYAGHHDTARPSAGAAEQNPADWMQHVEAALTRFAAHPRAGDVVAIGVTSQVNTHVFCDPARAPLHPAITWQDTRPAAQARRLDAAISPEDKTTALGAPIPIDASHALARVGWMAATNPEVWASTAHVMLPKDFAIAQLTGNCIADPISAVGLVGTDLRYAPAILDLFAGAKTVLPMLRDPLEVAGHVRKDTPFAGVPVATGTMDAWAGMFGLGVASEGEAIYLSGTSDVLGLISSDRPGAAGIITFPDWRGISLHAGPTQSGGASLVWLARILGQDVAALGRLAGQAHITRQSPLFLPHLEGERAPLWDAGSRGAFAGMTSATGPEELAACVMEGVAFSARLALEAIERSGNRQVHNLRHGGGGAASDIWCQIRANALGRTLERVKVPEVGAMGALVIAATAIGELEDLGEATQGLVAIDRAFACDPKMAALADDRFKAFEDLYRALGPVNATLQAP
ncbi:MAG TPA: carbohydrate kinase [Rhodobacteraceae bacterium]|nr:carbohydrate kinase [Paracoccaceae bacterium]